MCVLLIRWGVVMVLCRWSGCVVSTLMRGGCSICSGWGPTGHVSWTSSIVRTPTATGRSRGSSSSTASSSHVCWLWSSVITWVVILCTCSLRLSLIDMSHVTWRLWLIRDIYSFIHSFVLFHRTRVKNKVTRKMHVLKVFYRTEWKASDTNNCPYRCTQHKTQSKQMSNRLTE